MDHRPLSPAQAGSAQAGAGDKSPAEPGEGGAREDAQPRVLIVDDAVTVRMYHRQLVEAAGCRVEEAENGVEALECALRHPCALFLVDVNMPQMDGYRFMEEVRRTPELQSIPAIMISTEAQEGDKEKGYQAGVNMYLIKPVRPDILSVYVQLLAGAIRS